MAKLIIIFTNIILSILLFLLISTPISSSTDLNLSPILNSPCPIFPKSARIEVYVHEVLSGPNQNTYTVANASISSTSPSMFGTVQVADIKMTQNPDYNSPEVGRAQGIIAATDLKVLAFVEIGSFYFTSGRFNGSTISIIGRNAVSTEQNRELPITGGTGVFRCARGYVITSTYSVNSAMTEYVFTYTFYTTYVG